MQITTATAGQFCGVEQHGKTSPDGKLICQKDGNIWRWTTIPAPTVTAVTATANPSLSASPSSPAATLPVTGSSALLVAVLGAAILAAGGGLVAAMRRRSVRFHA